MAAAVLAVLAASTPAPAARAQTAAPAAAATDGWGVTRRQWVTLGMPELRRLAGFPSAAPRVLEAARAGDAQAMALISGAYATGSGVPRDPWEAFGWAQRAAATGHPLGLHVLALDYYYGTGVAIDYGRYMALLRKAADAGSMLAAGEFARQNFKGDAAPRDLPLAFQYARMAAEGGDDAEVKMLYGTLLFDRSLPGRDAREGARWIRAAAAGGLPFAQAAARALDAQDAFAANAKDLFVNSFGDGLVGGHTVAAAPDDPCVTQLVFDKDGGTYSFLINWMETVVSRGDDSALVLSGPIRSGVDRSGGEIRSSLGLTLHRNQLDVPDERDRIFVLGQVAATLSTVCHAM
ncbi:MAG: tetratricopeptide repeat protein [Pseudomonadota bacterium]